MASEPRRPPTRTGSGSRPPTSRFQEGSMNDRTSAAPPAQFMGPEQLKTYETQFYSKPPITMYEVRRPRPFSASGKLQGPAPPQHVDAQELQQPQKTVAHKKSMGFFGRVRDALFHRGGGQHGQAAPKEQDVRRKHSSLQEPVQNSQMPPPPRPQFVQHAGRTQSEVNIAQLFADAPGGAAGDRPSREDVLASYNQLMASGFFQSHAIQSTRHAAPTAAAAAAAAVGGRQAPGLPVDNQTAPRPPARVTSIHATARPTSISPMPARVPSPSPNPQGRNSSTTTAAPRTSLSSLFRPSIPDLNINTKESRYMLRGRKRTRGEYAPVSPEPQSSSSTSYFTQPLRRVAKKLREMPSSSSQLSEKAAIRKNTPVCVTQEPNDDDLMSSDGMMRLVPSISNGGSVHPNERPIRFHSPSPSPARPEMTAAGQSAQRSGRPFHERATSATRTGRPRRTFSYVVTESPRGRRAAAERERERDVRFHEQRGSSATPADDNTSKIVTRSSRPTTRSPNPLGQWQRVSLEDTIVHRDSTDSTRSQWDWEWEQRQATEVRIASSPANKLRKRPAQSPSPLRAVPDANRSVPKTPERWHHSGKAYHLKDRGSRLDLMTGVRHSEDSGKGYGKENDWRRVDADGDIDLLAHENPMPRENHYAEQQLHQWRIGNAL